MNNELVDIHNHGVWGIDDGVADKESAEKLIQLAKADGIRKIIATPHIVAGQNDDVTFETMLYRIQEFKELARLYGIDVYAGNELFLNHAYMELIQRGNFETLAETNYILVEFDVRNDIQTHTEADEWLYELVIRGYRPILAHAERYFHHRINIDRVKQWIALGCFIQVNRTSFLGLHGSQLKRNSYDLLHAGLVHLMASDAHECVGTRICKLQDAYLKLKRKFGEENAKQLCSDNPIRIIANEHLVNMKQRPSLIQQWIKR